MRRSSPNQFSEHQLDMYQTGYMRDYYNRYIYGGYNPYSSINFGPTKLSYYQSHQDMNALRTMDDGFDPYSYERYPREIGYDQQRYNTGLAQYAKYKTTPYALYPTHFRRRDGAHIAAGIITSILLILSIAFFSVSYLNCGKSADDSDQTKVESTQKTYPESKSTTGSGK